ncbi:hypothetical protein EON77_07530, partial [bacterium]
MIPTPALVAALDEGVSVRGITERFGEDAGRWASIQTELRVRARGRFGEAAARMLLVREALEQASHPLAARYRASLFPAGVEVVDLTAGIGADLTALALRGPTRGYELDPERAVYAAHNAGVSVEARDALESAPTRYWIADPARRSEGRRLTDAEEYAPPLADLLARADRAALALIKLSPLLPDRVLEREGAGLEFLSVAGECREAMLLLGSEARLGRRAVMITPDAVHSLDAADPGEAVDLPGAYLYDADPAAIRAHALGSVASASHRIDGRVDPEDLRRVAYDFAIGQAEQNVLYTEVHYTALTIEHHCGIPWPEQRDAIAAGFAAAQEETGTETRLILDIVRGVTVPMGERNLEWALDGHRTGLVAAMGLSGMEGQDPISAHAPVFAEARRQGLPISAHAGETKGPESIREALEFANPNRIGHGVRCVEDVKLVRELAERRIPLEVCPTSNVALGVFPSLEKHTLPYL